jgi:hypothetical protein
MSWVGHLTSNITREERSLYKVLFWKPEVIKTLLRLGRDLRIILKCLWRKWIGRTQNGLVWLRRCLLEYTFDVFMIGSTLCYI